MRKTIRSRGPVVHEDWLNLSNIAQVEVTSEDPDYPIDTALDSTNDISSPGWRAAVSGEQRITLVFDTPQPIRRIKISFQERRVARTQEFRLRWSRSGDGWQEIVRQQWNFSPESSPSEIEDYRVDLREVRMMELVIIPDISGGESPASLSALRLQ